MNFFYTSTILSPDFTCPCVNIVVKLLSKYKPEVTGVSVTTLIGNVFGGVFLTAEIISAGIRTFFGRNGIDLYTLLPYYWNVNRAGSIFFLLSLRISWPCSFYTQKSAIPQSPQFRIGFIWYFLCRISPLIPPGCGFAAVFMIDELAAPRFTRTY